MKMNLLYILLAVILSTTTGCDQPDFPKYSALNDLRIMGIVLDSPEVNPGDTVTFTPLLSDLNGQGRTIEYAVHGCIDPGVGIGALPQCAAADPMSIQTGTLTIPSGSGNTYTGPTTTFAVTMPSADIIFASRSAADQYNGVSYLVFYTISVPGVKTIDSFVRVVVSSPDKTVKNHNPAIASVAMNNEPITTGISIPVSITQFRVTTQPESSETYSFMHQDNGISVHTEELITTWFVSDGELDFTRTVGNVDNEWAPPSSMPAVRGMVLFVVTRDERGGTTYRKVELN